jgi:hypothetical protein
MKTDELRKGNWIKNGVIPTVVFGIDTEQNKYKDPDGIWYSIDNCSPIPLTQIELDKLGFLRSSSKSELWSFGNTMLIWRTEYESDMLDNYYEFRFGITASYKAERQVRLDYVHQLQNLTYILTGQDIL